jgi:transposase
MAMGQQTDRQGDLILSWSEMPRSPGHAFYDRLQQVLLDAGFDSFVEMTCKPFYAATMGARSVPPGRYFRMHMVGYFEGIASERGIEWRCSDSLSLREFLLLESRDRVPDHSWLSKTRGRLPQEVDETVFGWVLALIAGHGLLKGERIGIDASTMDANAALRAFDHGRECRPAGDCAPRHRRRLSRDADADGPGERHRDADDGRSDPYGPSPQRQEAVE